MLLYFVTCFVCACLCAQFDFNRLSYRSPKKTLGKATFSIFVRDTKDMWNSEEAFGRTTAVIVLLLFFLASPYWLGYLVVKSMRRGDRFLQRNPRTKGYALHYRNSALLLYYNYKTERWLLALPNHKFLPMPMDREAVWWYACHKAIDEPEFRALAQYLVDYYALESSRTYMDTVNNIKNSYVRPQFKLAFHNATRDLDPFTIYPIKAVFLHIGYGLGSPAQKYFYEQSRIFNI